MPPLAYCWTPCCHWPPQDCWTSQCHWTLLRLFDLLQAVGPSCGHWTLSTCWTSGGHWTLSRLGLSRPLDQLDAVRPFRGQSGIFSVLLDVPGVAAWLQTYSLEWWPSCWPNSNNFVPWPPLLCQRYYCQMQPLAWHVCPALCICSAPFLYWLMVLNLYIKGSGVWKRKIA
jgi:hypothetical protein